MFKRIKNAEELNGKEVLNDLLDFHHKKPGMTEATYGSLLTPNEQTSYEVLIDSLPTFKNARILDLACGNGPLMELILHRHPNIEKLIGIDLCQADLDAARKRMTDDRVDFLCGSAQSLPLESNSFDYVFCHLAFFLFDPIEEVVGEIRRVLKPGGQFATILSGLDISHIHYNQIVHILQEEVAKEGDHLRKFGWGDPRTHSLEGLKILFAKGFQNEIPLKNFYLVLEGKSRDLAEQLSHYFYSFDILLSNGKEKVINHWTEYFRKEFRKKSPKESNMTPLRFEFPLSRVVITKR